MGLYFRKSANFGLFKLNFSKSGVGLSTGVTGARINFGPKGTYVHLGRHGLYYKKYLGGFKSKQSPQGESGSINLPVEESIITSRNFENITDTNSQDFVKELEEKDNKASLLGWFGILPAAVCFLIIGYMIFAFKDIREIYSPYVTIVADNVNIRESSTDNAVIVAKASKFNEYPLSEKTDNNWYKIKLANDRIGFVYAKLANEYNKLVETKYVRRFDDKPYLRPLLIIAFFLIMIPWNLYLFRVDKKRKTVNIFYDIDENSQKLYDKFIEYFAEIMLSVKKWQVSTEEHGNDPKYYAGASTVVELKEISSISSNKNPTKYFQTNINIPYISLINTELYFLPERLLLKRKGRFAAVYYENISTQIEVVNLRQANCPSDAKVIDYTWRYVNKSGGPDRRFGSNPKIPICQFSQYSFHSSQGINETIMTSKLGAFDNFVKFIDMIKKYQAKYEYDNKPIKNGPPLIYGPKGQIMNTADDASKNTYTDLVDLINSMPEGSEKLSELYQALKKIIEEDSQKVDIHYAIGLIRMKQAMFAHLGCKGLFMTVEMFKESLECFKNAIENKSIFSDDAKLKMEKAEKYLKEAIKAMDV